VLYQGWSPLLRFFALPGRKMGGPYNTLDDLFSAMYAAAEFRAAVCTQASEIDKLDQSYLQDFKKTFVDVQDNQPVLTHLDLKFENIMVQRLGHDDWKVTIIDWDTLGWLPAFMQSMSLNERFCGSGIEIEEYVRLVCKAASMEFYTQNMELMDETDDAHTLV
jgi:hypothetical protein